MITKLVIGTRYLSAYCKTLIYKSTHVVKILMLAKYTCFMIRVMIFITYRTFYKPAMLLCYVRSTGVYARLQSDTWCYVLAAAVKTCSVTNAL